MTRRLLATITLLVAAQAHGDDARAHQNYLLHCMGCHGEAGRGLEGQVPSMHGTLAMLSRTPGAAYYVLRVPGVTQSTWTTNLAEVLNWSIRTFDAAPARSVPPFSPRNLVAEAAVARRGRLARTSASLVRGRYAFGTRRREKG
jgi:hypothetical protein